MSRMHTKTDGATGRPTRDAGYALPMSVFTLVLLGMMGVAGLQTSRDDLLSAVAVNSSSRAFYAAEAGIHNAVSTWNQFSLDTLVGGPGDTFVDSWTTIENGCSYQIVYRRIDGNDGNDRLYSVESTGRSPELDGASRSVAIIMKGMVIVAPGIAYDNWLGITGNPTIKGACSSVHTNHDSLFVSGNPSLGANLSTSGLRYGTGIPTDTLGSPITPLQSQPSLNIPQLEAMDYCGPAEYILDGNGQGLKVSTGETFDFTGGVPHWGWKYLPGPPTGYETASTIVDDGVYCVEGNISVGNNIGTPTIPAKVTFLATGSVQINGNPYMVTAHPDSILIMADGDLKLNGNPVAGATSMEGLLYGNAQCAVSGNPIIFGQLVCAGNPNPPGSQEWAVISEITGDMQLTYTCGGLLGSKAPKPLTERPWNHAW